MITAQHLLTDLGTLTAHAARTWPDGVALRFDPSGESLTFRELDRRSNAVAGHLVRRGVRGRDRVAVMLSNRPEFVLSWLAVCKLGATMVPVNAYSQPFELRYLLEDSGAAAVVTERVYLAVVDQASDLVAERAGVIVCDGEDAGAFQQSVDVGFAPVPPERAANLQYTSGTTGRPKGCVLSHGYWLRIARHLVADEPYLGPADTVLTAQPLYYLDPMWNVSAALMSGATLVVADRFHPSTFWRTVREHGVTFFYCLGAMPTLLLKTPPDAADRDHRVRAIYCSAIPTELHAELERRWGVPWSEMFGMTETGLDIRVRAAEHDELVGTGCIGLPVADREARVVDADGEVAPRGEVGELQLRGTGMMDGYHGKDEATAAAHHGSWLRTGDLVRMDQTSRIYYVGRAKDMIRRSGENISAAEVEHVICLHPKVAMAACVAVPDPIRQEEVKAYVVLDGEGGFQSVPPDELAEFCGRHLAYFKVPRYWTYRDDLPRTPSERVAKRKLDDEPATPTYDRVEQTWSP
ncbi:AMP-binding protein [Amycolatopsis taiwanensis]|uniref:Acyl-CoA synthetase n=1 Tax=Amycolatopsis taiwanensis TaxID=342230 RepID=A0A9W6R6N5_9PSEU|nr:AMP-binding protein [Amycolatopsis taiwanensis]GLY70248.1 acyl-CoA synthetase [Amycolatopsis taiwanensis]